MQDIRIAMQLLSSAPAVNLELWSQLSRAAGRQGYWQLAKECAVASLGALPADWKDLQKVVSAADVPEVSAQGWYWLSVAEMQQGQVSYVVMWYKKLITHPPRFSWWVLFTISVSVAQRQQEQVRHPVMTLIKALMLQSGAAPARFWLL